jgi:hypothetical protein
VTPRSAKENTNKPVQTINLFVSFQTWSKSPGVFFTHVLQQIDHISTIYIDHCIPKESAPERFPRFPTMHPRSLEKMAVRPPKAISAVADVADIMGMSSFTVHKYG